MSNEKNVHINKHKQKSEKELFQKPLYEQKCPNCGAPMVFNPDSGKIECAFCQTSLEIENWQQQKKETIDRKLRDHELKTMKPLPIYSCSSCGAELIAPETVRGTLTCPYCQNHIVLTRQFSGTIQPDGLIPFKIKPSRLASAMKAYYRGKRKLPPKFATRSKIGPVTGIYVPFWIFDCDVAGDVIFTGTKQGSVSIAGNTETTETRHYRMTRTVSMQFADLAVDASRKMADDLMDSVQPFDLSAIVDFDVKYLAGFVADRFDQTSEAMRSRNDLRVRNTGAKVTKNMGVSDFSNVAMVDNRLSSTIRRARYVLLPVYTFSVDYAGRAYSFALNGQTGKVVGKVPEYEEPESSRFIKWFAAGFGVMAAALWLLFVR